MALDQTLRNGQVYITGTGADIAAAESGSTLVKGRLYWETDGSKRVGRAIETNLIRWEISASDIATAVAAEAALRLAGDQALQTAIDAEVTARAQDVDAEETARIAAVSALQTQIATDIANLAAALRDERVTDYKGYTYSANESASISSILGANPLEGIHVVKFNSADINNTATLTGLPGGAADMTITYNDAVRVVVNEGAITSVTLVDDALKVKFDAIDSSITALQAATTPSAIQSHFSATGFAKYANGVTSVTNSTELGNDVTADAAGNIFLDVDQTSSEAGGSAKTINQHLVDLYALVSAGAFDAENGLTKDGDIVKLGGALTANTTVSGDFKLDFTNTQGVGAEYLRMPCFNVDGTSRGTKATGYVEVWFDQDGDPKYTFAPN